MRAESALNLHAIHYLWTGPSLGRNQYDNRPGGTLAESILTRVFLNGANILDHGFEGRGHGLVHGLRLVTLDVISAIPAAFKELGQLFTRNPREYGGAGDLIAVQMQDRNDRPVRYGIEKLVRVPACGQRPGLRFP